MKSYERLNVTEFKVGKNAVGVEWTDGKGDGKSLTSVDLPSQELSESLGKLKEILALHLALPVDRISATGAKYRQSKEGDYYFTVTGTLTSHEAGVENSVNCTLVYDEDADGADLDVWGRDDAEAIMHSLFLAGCYAQGDRRKEEPSFFDAEYEECDDEVAAIEEPF